MQSNLFAVHSAFVQTRLLQLGCLKKSMCVKATEDCFCRCFFFFLGLTSKRNGILTWVWQYERINENQLNIIFYFQKKSINRQQSGTFSVLSHSMEQREVTRKGQLTFDLQSVIRLIIEGLDSQFIRSDPTHATCLKLNVSSAITRDSWRTSGIKTSPIGATVWNLTLLVTLYVSESNVSVML